MLPKEIERKGRHTDISYQFERMDLVIEHLFPKVHIFSMYLGDVVRLVTLAIVPR
jgi:hypothetical protein